jgi:hypothetical protein
MFQNLFNLHREFAYDEIIVNERQIAESFQYRPSLLSNIERIRFNAPSIIPSSISTSNLITNTDKNRLTFAATPTPKTSLSTAVRSTSFSNRADIEAFQQKKETIQPVRPIIESNEIDLTKLIRDSYSNNRYVLISNQNRSFLRILVCKKVTFSQNMS